MKRIITECDACGRTREQEGESPHLFSLVNPYTPDTATLLEQLEQHRSWLTVTVQTAHGAPVTVEVCSDHCAELATKKAVAHAREHQAAELARTKDLLKREADGASIEATYEDLGGGRVGIRQIRGTR